MPQNHNSHSLIEFDLPNPGLNTPSVSSVDSYHTLLPEQENLVVSSDRPRQPLVKYTIFCERMRLRETPLQPYQTNRNFGEGTWGGG